MVMAKMKNHDKLYPKQALKYQRGDNIGQGAHRKRQKKTTWRRLWIMPYTAIVQLGSSPGHTSSDKNIVPIRAKYFNQDQGTPPSWATWASRRRGGGCQGRGPWKPAWPPPGEGTEKILAQELIQTSL